MRYAPISWGPWVSGKRNAVRKNIARKKKTRHMNVKMNGGTGVLLVFAGFGGLMAYMTYRCMHTPVDLVAREYYKDELSYQQVIDARKKADGLSGEVDLRQAGGFITCTLPREMRNTAVKGSIQFY